MPRFIVIESRKSSQFDRDAKILLEGHKLEYLGSNTYKGASQTRPVVNELKNLESYKKNKTSSSITIYHGTLSK